MHRPILFLSTSTLDNFLNKLILFVSGASLLRGLGRMHTVARNLQDYEELVVALLQTKRNGVQSLVRDVRAIRSDCTLWNTEAWVRAIESLALHSFDVRSIGASMHVIASATA
jgi:hypothetical protein